MDASYAQAYRELFERHWWWRARERLVLDTFTRHGLPRGREAILDIGCGDALFFDRLATFGDVWGVEPDARIVAPDGPWASRVHIGPFDRTFAPGRRYSLILMLDVLEHLERPVEALTLVRELLQPDGLLVLTVPAFRALWTRHDDLNHHRTRYTAGTCGEALRTAGFLVRESRYFLFWACAAKLAVRLKERLVSGPARPPRVPPAPVNRILFTVSRAEEAVFGRLPMPFGSSLLVVAAPGVPGHEAPVRVPSDP